MRTNPYAKPPQEKRPDVILAYNDLTRMGLLSDGSFYKNIELYIGGETYKRLVEVWDEMYKGETADRLLADLLRIGINHQYWCTVAPGKEAGQ